MHDDGAWLVYLETGDQPGEGGDCYSVLFFGDEELKALHYVNEHRGYRAVFIKPGQSILDAEKKKQ